MRTPVSADPKRSYNWILPCHWQAEGDILADLKVYPCSFDFSFKYSVAHRYTITKPTFVQPLLEGLAPGRRT